MDAEHLSVGTSPKRGETNVNSRGMSIRMDRGLLIAHLLYGELNYMPPLRKTAR
jgi:hypothetical protein